MFCWLRHQYKTYIYKQFVLDSNDSIVYDPVSQHEKKKESFSKET